MTGRGIVLISAALLHAGNPLRDLPVRLPHAPADRVVPAALGEELCQRPGRPERWDHPSGHLGLFAALPAVARTFVRWVDQHVHREDAYSDHLR